MQCDSPPPAADGLESENQTGVTISFNSNVDADTKINQIVQKLAAEA